MDGSVETSRRTLGPKPRLAPKPFSLQKTSTIRSIDPPRAFTATSKPTNVPPGNAETTSVPKGTLPVTAQTPPQRTAAADSKPSPLSVRVKDEAKTDGENRQREDPLAQTTGAPKASTPTTAQTPPRQTTAPVSGHSKDPPKPDSKTEESKSRAGASDSTAAPGKTDPVLQSSGAPPAPQKPQQTTTTDEHSPVSVSKHVTDEPKPTTPGPHTEDSPVVAPAKLEDVIQTNHKAAAEKNEEDKTSVRKPEESGSASPSADNPAYQWGGTRRRLSSTLTSKFESSGPPVCPQPTTTASPASNKDAVKKPVTPPPERSPAAPEPSKAAGSEEEPIDYSGGDSIKRRISQLFDSSLRPEAVTKKEEPDIKAGSGGVKERIKNWVTDTGSEDPKPQVVQRTRSRSVDSPASPVGDTTPIRADVQLPSPPVTQAVTPSTKDSPVKQTPVETSNGEAVEKKPHERTTDLPGEQNAPVEAEVTLRHPKASTDHAAAGEGRAGSSGSPALKRNNGKRRSVRFGIVETDDGAPPLILGSPSDSSSEEDPSEEKGGENTSASPPVYRRVGSFMKTDGERQKNEEEHEKRVELEKRLKAEEDKQARLKLEELKREDEEREKENARRREEEKQREEERENQRLKEQEVQRQKEEERERQRLKEEEQKKQMEKLRADKEKELEQMRQKEEERARARQMEERLRLEEVERVRKEAEERERENQRRREEEEKMKARQRQEEEEERIRRMELEIRMQQEKEEEKERMRKIEKQREDDRRKQLEKERVEEIRRLKELEEKLRTEEAKTRDLISLDSKDVPQKSEARLSSVPNPLEPSENAADIIYDDFSVKKPKIDVDFEDFSVKPRRWGSQAKVEKPPPVRSWRAEPAVEDAAVLADVRRQESTAPERAAEPDRPEPARAVERPEEEEEEEEEPAEERPGSVELEEEDGTGEADSTDGESEDGEEQINSYCVNPEDKDTDALIDTSPDQQNGFCELTNQADSPTSVPEHVPEVSSEDVDPTDSSTQPDFVPFPESSAPLLDNSAQRSKVALRKSQIRRAPSRSLRLAQTESQSWRVHDSTDEKNGSTKQEDSEPQGKQPKLHKASSPSTAMNPAAQLIAQLKRRTSGGGAGKKEVKEEVKQREESEGQQEEVAPTPAPRSPRKSAQLAGAALVLPPLGGSDGGAVSSPAWLKELKSKKRLSQHDSET